VIRKTVNAFLAASLLATAVMVTPAAATLQQPANDQPPGDGPEPAAGPSSNNPRLVRATDGGSPNAEIADARLSADGRWLVFSSFATNLVPGEQSGFSEVYAADTTTGAVTLLTRVPEGGGSSDGDSFEPVVCDNGSVVAFTTEAELLDPVTDDDFNGETDVYVVFRDANGSGVFDQFDVPGGVRITRVSVGGGGEEADFGAASPAISGDCSTVAFAALDPLADEDLNDLTDVYVRDIRNLPEDVFDFEAPELVTMGADPSSTNAGGGDLPALNFDGSKVAFISTGSGFVASGPDADKGGVLLRDRSAGTTRHLSVRAANGQASSGSPDPSAAPVITPNGRCVAFKFISLDLAPGVTNNQGVYVRDTQRNTTRLASVSYRGLQATEAANPAISPDCRFVGFDSADSRLVVGDNNNARDAFVHDFVTRGTGLVSRTAAGRPARGQSTMRQLTANGQALVNSSAPEVGGVGGGDGTTDPFLVTVGRVGFRSPGFADVPALTELDQATAWLAFHKLGDRVGVDRLKRPLFGPAQVHNRIGFSLYVWRMMGKPGTKTSCGFTDAKALRTADQRRAACWLKDQKIVTGRAFQPLAPTTRVFMANTLWRVAGRPTAPVRCGLADAPRLANDTVRRAACWLRQTGISLQGGVNKQGKPEFRPTQQVQRRVTAVSLYRLASTARAWNLRPNRLPATINFDR